MLLGNLLIDSVDQRHVHGFNLALCPQKPLPLRGCWYFYRKMCLSSWQKTQSNDLWCYLGPQSDKYISGQSIKKKSQCTDNISFWYFHAAQCFWIKRKNKCDSCLKSISKHLWWHISPVSTFLAVLHKSNLVNLTFYFA